VEDATTLRPITLHTSNSQVAVTRHEEEVIINKLLTHPLVHSSEWVVGTCQVTLEPLQGSGDKLLDTNALFLGDSGRQTKSLDGAANTNPDRVNWNLWVDVSIDLGRVHVRDMLEVGWESVVLADQGIKDISEINVGVLVTSVDAAVLVIELNGASNGLGQGEAGGLGDNVAKLGPLCWGHMFGNQTVLGFDVGECASDAVLLLEGQVFLVQGVDTVNHGLHKLDLGVSQPMLVGDVVGVSRLSTRLTTGAAGLDSKFLAPGLELVNTLLGPARKVHVD